MRKTTPTILMLVLTLIFQGSFAYCMENGPAWSIDEEGIKVDVWTPLEAYPGDNISLTIKVKAKEDITNVYITIRLQALKTHSEWETYLHPLENEELSGQELRFRNCNVTVPVEVLPGAVLGHVYCSWKVYRSHVWRDRSYEDSFQAIYLKNRDFEQLQQSYSDLNDTYYSTLEILENLTSAYNSTLSDLQDLQSQYHNLESSVSGARTLSYCLIAATIIFAGSTGFLLLKRRKEQQIEA